MKMTVKMKKFEEKKKMKMKTKTTTTAMKDNDKDTHGNVKKNNDIAVNNMMKHNITKMRNNV